MPRISTYLLRLYTPTILCMCVVEKSKIFSNFSVSTRLARSFRPSFHASLRHSNLINLHGNVSWHRKRREYQIKLHKLSVPSQNLLISYAKQKGNLLRENAFLANLLVRNIRSKFFIILFNAYLHKPIKFTNLRP